MTTGSVEGRVRSLQTGNPNEIYIHAVFIFQDVTPQDVRDMERYCHELLGNYRMKGEWFSVSPEAAAEVIGEAMDIAEEDATKGFIERNIGWILLALFFLWLFF